MDWIDLAGWSTFVFLSIFAVWFLRSSLRENESRAAFVSFVLWLLLSAIFLPVLLAESGPRDEVLLGTLGLLLTVVLILIVPAGKTQTLVITKTQHRLDERDHAFSRFIRLQVDTPAYTEYYQTRPQQEIKDKQIRALPDLGQPGSKTFSETHTPIFQASFDVLAQLSAHAAGDNQASTSSPVMLDTHHTTLRIKGLAQHLGACLVGCTKLNPAYIYSHIGRSPGRWGQPIELTHTHAIVIAVEMSCSMVHQAPNIATIIESAKGYFDAAKIATVVARYIKLLGYTARAHIDGNYRVLCTPLAVEAGLGELGRLGLLITPRFGPRVRLAVVTTNLALTQDQAIAFGVQDFCLHCKKCAVNCPSGSISPNQKQLINGVWKWQSRQDSCYRFWRQQGTDCALCLKVCPYSHPDTGIHNLVRWLNQRNDLTRRLMIRMDDLFYGRKPKTVHPRSPWLNR